MTTTQQEAVIQSLAVLLDAWLVDRKTHRKPSRFGAGGAGPADQC